MADQANPGAVGENEVDLISQNNTIAFDCAFESITDELKGVQFPQGYVLSSDFCASCGAVDAGIKSFLPADIGAAKCDKE